MAPSTDTRKPSLAEIELYERIRDAERSIGNARLLLANDRRAGARMAVDHAIAALQDAERALRYPVTMSPLDQRTADGDR